MSEPIADLLKRAADIQREGRRVVVCLVVKASGSTPQSAGALMIVDDAANSFGTIGGGCVEAEVRRRAFAMLTEGRSEVMRFKLDHDYGWDDGLLCGGTIELAVAPPPESEVLQQIVGDLDRRQSTSLSLQVQTGEGPAAFTLALPPRERLYIAGAGHIGQATAALALPLEFDVTMFDDRADLLGRFAPSDVATVPGDIAANLSHAPIDDETYCLIVTRGHRHDEQALEAVVGRGAGYVGMIGSRRKVKLIFDDLLERGVPEAQLACVNAPVGVDIGAVTVQEIAVSIIAQLIQRRREIRRHVVTGPHPLAEEGDAAASSPLRPSEPSASTLDAGPR